MALLLDGKKVRDALVDKLSKAVSKCSTVPTLAILQAGDRADSNSYISQKKILADKIGVRVLHKKYSENVGEGEILKDISALNKDAGVGGIIIQIPLPAHLNKTRLLEAIDPQKDVDGLTSANTKKLWEGEGGGIVPATARGVVALLDHYQIPIEGKKVVVVGRSALVGKPTAFAFLNRNATVSICHSKSARLAGEAKSADILVVAAGKPRLIGPDCVGPDQIVIDVGITGIDESGKKKLRGDVDFEKVEPIVKAISPVPGGVGPMTVVSLFLNLLEACGAKL